MNTVCCFDKISEKIKNLFGRNTKYQKVVAAARWAAKGKGTTIVFQQGKHYNWTFEWLFPDVLEQSDQPVIKLLICLPDGTVAQ